MSILIKGMDMPKDCEDCIINEAGACGFDKNTCPLIEIDLERDIPTIWYNKQTGQYEPKGTKQEVYERLYKLKNGERRE